MFCGVNRSGHACLAGAFQILQPRNVALASGAHSGVGVVTGKKLFLSAARAGN